MPRVYTRLDPMQRVLRHIRVDTDTNCWLFTGFRNADGYGCLTERNPWRLHKAHAVVYAAVRGPVPDGYVLHHECHTPACCNPWHLTPLTRAQHGHLHHVRPNRTHCKHGHAFTQENSMIVTRRTGHRAGIQELVCRECNRSRPRH